MNQNARDYTYVQVLPEARKGTSRSQILWELELQAFVSGLQWVLGAKSGSLKEQQALLAIEPSLQS